MRFLAALAMLAVGFGAGWAFRDSQPADAPVRTDRQEASRKSPPTENSSVPPSAHPHGPDIDPPPPAPEPEPSSSPAPEDTEPEAATAEEEPDEEAKKLATFMKSMLPLMKMQSTREGREEAAALGKLLALDEHREKQLADVLSHDKVRKLEEGVIPMLEGKQPDEQMLANLNEVDGMSGALENDLSLILNTHEMDTVKTHYREQREAAQRESIEAEVKGLAIPDLSEDQEQRLRAILKEEQGTSGITATGTSASTGGGGFAVKMKKSLSEDGMVDSLDSEYKQRREKLARFLSMEQLAHLDKQHEEKRAEAKAAAGMMGGLMGAVRVRTKEPPKKDD